MEHEIFGYRRVRKILHSILPLSPEVLATVPTYPSGVVPPSEAWLTLGYLPHTSSIVSSMVKTRLEYGHIESHPRHGRINSDDAVGYCEFVLKQYFLPLCKGEWEEQKNKEGKKEGGMHTNATPESVLDSCRVVIDSLNLTKECGSMLSRLYTEFSSISPVPSVVCHCDLQPQNLAFSETSVSSSSSDSTVPNTFLHSGQRYTLLGVMDYEESRYADPRFELMFLCRRVCCDVEQAREVWGIFKDGVKGMGWEGGELGPWLRLECLVTIVQCWVRVEKREWIKDEGRGVGVDVGKEREKIKREMERWGMFEGL